MFFSPRRFQHRCSQRGSSASTAIDNYKPSSEFREHCVGVRRRQKEIQGAASARRSRRVCAALSGSCVPLTYWSPVFSAGWVSTASDGWHAAFVCLTRCQHSTAQMVAPLNRFPLVRYSCRTKVVSVPTPNDAVRDNLVRKYLYCPHRSQDVSFIEWCRAFRTNQEIPTPYRGQLRGGTACAFQVTTWHKDSFFGQWLVFNKPASVDTFRSDWYHDASRRVPSYLFWLSVCFLHRPD